MAFVKPKRWSAEEISHAVSVSASVFSQERKTEGIEYYVVAFDAAADDVRKLLEDTEGLSRLESDALDLLAQGRLREMRYLASPAISEDDLKSLSSVRSLSRSSLADEANARSITDVIRQSLDPKRFPWVYDGRKPTGSEEQSAIIATAALMAGQETQTKRRSLAKERQEGQVCSFLVSKGFKEVRRRTIMTVADAPKSNEFCRESSVSGKKADFVVGLADGRFMAVECKVSNSEVNSFKRLNHETVEKVKHWDGAFGSNGVVGVAVLSGVFKTANVIDAQNDGVSIIWSHDLGELGRYIDEVAEASRR